MVSIIAINVKRIMKERGLKQNATGIRAGYTKAAFNNMLNGRKLITDVDVQNICNALGVTPNDLFGLEESKSA